MFRSRSPHTYVFLMCLPVPDVLAQFASKMRNAENEKFRPPGFNELQRPTKAGRNMLVALAKQT
jgi:hypothetical protein